MATVATREDSDVAILPTAAHRNLMFVWWQAITLVFSIAGALVAAALFGRDRSERGIAITFGLVATWTTLVATLTLFNFTFLFGIYSVIPLTALVIAVPTPLSDVRRRGAALVAVALFGLLAGVRAAKVGHAAITWNGRDPGRIEPSSSATSRRARASSGRRRLHRPGRARGVALSGRPAGEPGRLGALDAGHRTACAETVAAHRRLPDLARARRPAAGDRRVPRTLIDTYEPPPLTLPSMAWVVEDDPFAQYPTLHLYALGGRCGV
jgi:hypothetical protein